MLERAVHELKSNPAHAVQKFNRGLEGFQDRDLYVFCAQLDGKLVAHTNSRFIGNDVRNFKDKTGREPGKQLLSEAKEGEITQITYMHPRPGETEPLVKVSYITRVADLACGVGYYK
jgi:signal transduction histidine kinase